jgi:hypothetical protein
VAKGGDFAPVQFDVIGSGKDVARSTVDFFGVPIACQQARFVAGYALRQAKEFTAGSGKRTEIWEMATGEAAFKTYPFWIDDEEIETDFSILKTTLRSIFLAGPDSEVGMRDFSSLLQGIFKGLKEYHRAKIRDREKRRRRDAEAAERWRRHEGQGS